MRYRLAGDWQIFQGKAWLEEGAISASLAPEGADKNTLSCNTGTSHFL